MGKELLLRIAWVVGLCVASAATVIVADTWYHGAVEGQSSGSVRVYDPAQTAGEIQSGIEVLSAGGNRQPADGAADVPRDATLTWPVGPHAGTYDVYFGTSAADLNSATRTDTTGLLVSLGQAATTFDPPGPLAYGQTYCWRIDEVDQSAGGTVYKGDVWSFTVEPFARLVKPASAAASSSQVGMGPEKTFDGSGLDKNDQHGTDPTTMWLSTGTQPNWIQYQFDRVYKFHDLKVWNSNQPGEGTLGFGARKVKIEYCADGITWHTLDHVPEFAQGPGTPGYTANTTVNLGGVLAKQVRLTIQSTWSGLNGIAGLSEVRFSCIPVQAFSPQPADGTRDVPAETGLSWRPGREAALHRVFFGTDQAAVAAGTAPALTLTDHRFAPGELNYGTAYYWKVDEVNAVTYVGDVWSFTTKAYAAVVDDFESYNDTDHRIYDTWIDGRTDGKSGSIVGHAEAPFAERMIVHGGQQAMPLEYNNVNPPYYSEASRTFEPPQDWTTHGAIELVFYWRGYYVSLLEVGDGSLLVYGGGRDIGDTSDQFHFVYQQFSGDGSLTILVKDISAWAPAAKAGLMVRETLDPGSKNAYIAVTGGNGVTFQWRAATDGATADSRTAGFKAPYWVRITRTGNVFKAERSADGKAWTQQGPDTVIPMAASVYIGMAVTSHDTTEVVQVRFSDVSSTGAVTGPWQKSAVGTTLRVNDPDMLYVTVEDAAGRSTTLNWGMAAETGGWTRFLMFLKDLGAAGVNPSAVKRLTIGVGDKTGAKPGGTGLIYIDDIDVGKPLPRPATRS